jgi:hypothetical protein
MLAYLYVQAKLVMIVNRRGVAMLPDTLIPEQIVRQNGESVTFPIACPTEATVAITLNITRIIERESLELSILGSADGKDWDGPPLLKFTPKFYCGAYRLRLDLGDHASVRHLKLKWTVNRWGHPQSAPLFGLSVCSRPEAPIAQPAWA